ncbi:MAG TPA: hypothetical protein DIV39_01180 [Verrucomicrobiales bacterium]|nr:hypothetical protein [Verrucomicrobiales bacterium]|tara:strand:- start:1988 stop:2845 length:858 start_codon:yes stop_codon:yes gene_type:complete
MIEPLQKGDLLIDDMVGVEGGENCFHVWWLGQSGFLLKWDGHFLLFDPYLSNSLTRKYEGTDKPHVRMSELVVDPSRLTFVKTVTSSHNHTDHLDRETLVAIAEASGSISLVLPEANIGFAKERLIGGAIDYVGINEMTVTGIGPWKIEGIAAAHNEVERDGEGRCVFLGFRVTFGGFRVYHSGDTLWHAGLEGQLSGGSPDLALLPINGNKPERRVAGNLNGREAAELAHTIGARVVVPCHYDMFTFNTEEPDEFISFCESLGQSHKVMKGGERITIHRGKAEL